MNEYDLIYEELCERVECGELSLEDAEIINDVAYDRYVKEDMSDISLRNAERLENLRKNKQIDTFGDLLRRPHRKQFNSNSEFKDALNNYDHGERTKALRNRFNKNDVDMYRWANTENRSSKDYAIRRYKRNLRNRAENIKDAKDGYDFRK